MREERIKEWEELGIEVDPLTRIRVRGFIMPECPWLDAAERMIVIVGRPAAELTKLFAEQLDLYSLSPEEEAHKTFEREVDTKTHDERLKLSLAMSAYTGSPVSPLNEEVYEWASQVINTIKRYNEELTGKYNDMVNAIWAARSMLWNQIYGEAFAKVYRAYEWYDNYWEATRRAKEYADAVMAMAWPIGQYFNAQLELRLAEAKKRAYYLLY